MIIQLNNLNHKSYNKEIIFFTNLGTMSFLMDPIAFSMFFDWAYENCPRIVTHHGLFHGVPKGPKT